MSVDAFGLTDTGKVRENNEDHFVIATLRKAVDLGQTSLENGLLAGRVRESAAQLFVVADGVGGHTGGELASGAAVQCLLEYVAQAAGCFHDLGVDQENEFLQRLEAGIQRAHERIQRELGGGGEAPSTTLTLAALVGLRAYLVHVGDSRAYYLTRGRLRQLTRDQTMGEYLVDAGAWTEETAARARTAGNLISTVGGAEMTPSIGLVDLAPGDVLLLCTDGLTKHVADPQIAEVLGTDRSAAQIARELMDLALASGGSDNVTVIVAKLGSSE
jgi:serine/threonine protein phosphatase PrpC